jgi:hypothetical protein
MRRRITETGQINLSKEANMAINKLFALVAALMMMLATSAFADVRVFTRASGDGLNQFVQQLTEGGVLQNDRFPSLVLGNLAFDFASQNGHLERVPTSNRNRESYAALFVRWNGLAATLSLQEFQRKGQGNGFWLPVVRGGGTPVVPTATAADLIAEALAVRGLAAIDAFAGVRDSILTEEAVREVLQSALADGTLSQAIVDDVMATMGTLFDIDGLNRRLEVVENAIAADTTAVSALETRVDNVSTMMWVLALAILLIVVGTLIWFWSAVRKTATKTKTDVDQRITTMETNLSSRLSSVVEGVANDVAALDTRVDKVEARLECRADVHIPANLEEVLNELSDDDKLVQVVTVNQQSFQLTFTKVTENGKPAVRIAGIKDQRQAVLVDRVRSRILRAAGKGHLLNTVRVIAAA